MKNTQTCIWTLRKNALEYVKANMEAKEEQTVELPLQMYLMVLFKPHGTQGFQENSWDFKGRKTKWIETAVSELRCHPAPPIASWTPSKYYE